MSLVSISRELCREIEKIDFTKVAAFTYNPLAYARIPHEKYLKKWGSGSKRVMLLGMNPGPFGMAQTGVPFGDVRMVRDFIGITGKVTAPQAQHPKRLITGFECTRSEVSGTRLWSFAQEHFKTPEAFFEDFFVVNYCPLVFMDEGGRNLTPDKLPRELRLQIDEICGAALKKMTQLLAPEWFIGIGAFAEKKAQLHLKNQVKIGTILHPSPASPKANRGWAQAVSKQFDDLGIKIPS